MERLGGVLRIIVPNPTLFLYSYVLEEKYNVMKKMILFLAVLMLALSSCKDKDANLNNDGTVNLSNLQIGQKSIYKEYQTSCAGFEDDFHYTGNYMELEVIEMENGELGFRESCAKEFTTCIEVAPVEYGISQGGNSVIIPDRSTSKLFFFFDNDELSLDFSTRIPLVQEGCMLHLSDVPFIGNDMGELSSMVVGDIEYTDLTAVSCEPYFELDAYLIYDGRALHGSHVNMFDVMFGEDVVKGWVLVE